MLLLTLQSSAEEVFYWGETIQALSKSIFFHANHFYLFLTVKSGQCDQIKIAECL